MTARSGRARGWRWAAGIAVLSSVMLSVRVVAQDPDLERLRRDVQARFDVVPLRQGVALIGRAKDHRVEVADGLVLADGTPLAGSELRSRLGADAPLVLKLTYLSNEDLKRLFAPPPAAPAPPAAAPRPAVPPAPAAPPVPVTPAIATPPTPPLPPPPPGPPARIYHRTGARLGLGKSITIAEDEEVTEAVVSLFGDITVSGKVRDDVVAVGGSVHLTPTADVRGDVTAVGGEVTLAPGSIHSGRVHTAAFDGWGPGWPSFGWSRFGMAPAARWLTLAGTLVRVMLLALLVGAIVFLARGRVGRVGAAVAATPVRAALVGVAAQLLFVPLLVVVSVVMAITIIGLPFLAIVIPLALLAMLAAMLLGIASLAQTLGTAVADRLGWHADTVAWAIGLGIVVLPTILARLIGVGPLAGAAVGLLIVGTIAEYLAWTIGLGAAVMTGLGRWSTVPPPIPSAAMSAPSAF